MTTTEEALLKTRIYDYLKQNERLDEIELSEKLNIPLLCVCGAVWELREEKKIKKIGVYKLP